VNKIVINFRWGPGRGKRTADPSASLGMTKGGVALPWGIG
jgi:hypothetical protein